MQAEQILIQKIASRPSTEELIFFIAQDEEITSACSDLQRKLAGNNKKELNKINDLCQQYHISPAHLTREIDHIQSIFSPRKTATDDHKVLGLQADASLTEVKQAFRRLSLEYHPDTSDTNDAADFIRITKAYHRLIKNADKKSNTVPAQTAWRYRKKTPHHEPEKKNYLFWFSMLTAAVLFVIVGISIHYQQRTMLKNISRRKSVSTEQTPPVKEISPAVETRLAGSGKHELHNAPVAPVTTEKPLKKREQEGILTTSSRGAVTQETEPPLPSEHPPQEEAVSVSPRPVSSSPENMSRTQPPVIETTADDEVEHVSNPPPSFSAVNFDRKKSSVQESQQIKVDSITGVKAKNTVFADIVEPKQSGKMQRKTTLKKDSRSKSKKNLPISSDTDSQERKNVAVKLVVNAKEKKVQRKKSATSEQAPQQGIPARNALRQFVRDYTTIYMKKDIRRLSSFFVDGALENGVPFSRMRGKYKQLFKEAKKIDYRIDILNTDIQNKGTSATMTGRFHVKLDYRSKKKAESAGTITFFLVKKDRTYKVKGLTYHLDPKW